jgi:hypothetical protein
MLQLTFFSGPLAAGMTTDYLQERVEQLQRDLSKEPPISKNGGFGERLKEAVKRRVSASYSQSQSRVTAEGDESFGERLKKEVQKKQEPARKAKEKERDRWHRAAERAKPRKRTKGE